MDNQGCAFIGTSALARRAQPRQLAMTNANRGENPGSGNLSQRFRQPRWFDPDRNLKVGAAGKVKRLPRYPVDRESAGPAISRKPSAGSSKTARARIREESLEKRFRSYLVQEQTLFPPQFYALRNNWDEYGLDFDPLEPWDFEAEFGRGADAVGYGGVVLDVGFGNPPDSLIQMARTRSDTDFVGVEVQHPNIADCCILLERYRTLRNVRLYHGDVFNALNEMCPDRSLAEVCVFFPDEFSHPEDAKRRLIRPLFVELLLAKLRPGGRLRIATQHDAYARHVVEVMSRYPQFWGGELLQRPPDRPATVAEKEAMQEGMVIRDFLYVLRTLKSAEEISRCML
ncbi:tRNA (guanine-N(7)-)-methyltransferase [Porphyridium purpureum]|uniref:tRNA (guanine(46)-N(7))-methyltransferase n=1 Tax=Porphyridium purpureum TaxID=35688 RepID=A0A5J4ZAH2_PORPP|nr:tRNA (guanine-N(7)-)-methyltransferase [Porphyridium purpureum]|eukprot:POR5176..scf295_1